MTPQERKLIDELFDRLASLESNPRDPDAVRAINEGLQRAPNALYPLVQTALVQDEALKRADARIRELEDELELEPGEPVKQPGFLDNMRDALLGKPHGSVPSVRPGAPAAASPWGNTAAQPARLWRRAAGSRRLWRSDAGAAGRAGGSFLGTAAATAAGVVGGALLMNSFRGMFGGHNQGQSAFDSGGGVGRAVGPRRQRRRSRPRRRPRTTSAAAGARPTAATARSAPACSIRRARTTAISMAATIDVGGDFGGDGGSDTA